MNAPSQTWACYRCAKWTVVRRQYKGGRTEYDPASKRMVYRLFSYSFACCERCGEILEAGKARNGDAAKAKERDTDPMIGLPDELFDVHGIPL